MPRIDLTHDHLEGLRDLRQPFYCLCGVELAEGERSNGRCEKCRRALDSFLLELSELAREEVRP